MVNTKLPTYFLYKENHQCGASVKKKQADAHTAGGYDFLQRCCRSANCDKQVRIAGTEYLLRSENRRRCNAVDLFQLLLCKRQMFKAFDIFLNLLRL